MKSHTQPVLARQRTSRDVQGVGWSLVVVASHIGAEVPALAAIPLPLAFGGVVPKPVLFGATSLPPAGLLALACARLLGPVEASMELAAFLVTFIVVGWRPGQAFPHGAPLLAASGAAFTAVVLGQVANAFACRSTVKPVWRVGWATNRLLLGAIIAELAMLGAFLYVPFFAHLLGQSGPSWAGFGIAVLAMPAVLVADTAHKRIRARPARGAHTAPRRSVPQPERPAT